jgi:hypothetical protein
MYITSIVAELSFEDSTSSDLNTANSAGGATTDYFDLDSLCNSGYYDMYFGTFSTDSVPRLLDEPNTPMPPITPDVGDGLQIHQQQQQQTMDEEGGDSSRGPPHNTLPVPFPVSPSQQRKRVEWKRGILRYK